MLPDVISILVRLNGEPAAGLFVICTLHAKCKNDFQLAFGPSREGGQLEVSRAEIREQAEKERRLFPMDYGDVDSSLAGRITITPMNRVAIERARAAYQQFRGISPYPASYGADLEHALGVLARSGGDIVADVKASGGSMPVVSTPVRA